MILLLSTWTPRASAQTHLVLILAPADEARSATYIDLQLAVWAHLSARPVTVVIHGIEEPIDGEVARRVVDETGALSAAWLSDEGRTFCFLTPGLDPRPRVRAVPGDEEPWISRCEVMATVLHADVEQRLVELDEAPTPTPVEEKPSGPAIRFVAGVGYAPALMSAPGGPFLQGFSIGAGAQIGRHVGFRAGVDLVQSWSLGIPDSDAWLARMPIRLEATFVVPVGRFDLGGNLGSVVEITEVRDLDYEPADERAKVPQVAAGLSGALHARVRILPWLAPFLLVGADLYFADLEWMLSPDVLLRRDPIVLRLTVGVSFLVGPR